MRPDPKQLLGRGRGQGNPTAGFQKSCCVLAGIGAQACKKLVFRPGFAADWASLRKIFEGFFSGAGQKRIFICRGGLMGVGEEVSSSEAPDFRALILMRPAKQDARAFAQMPGAGASPRARAPSLLAKPGRRPRSSRLVKSARMLSSVAWHCSTGRLNIPCRQNPRMIAPILCGHQASEGFFPFCRRDPERPAFGQGRQKRYPGLEFDGLGHVGKTRLSAGPRPKTSNPQKALVDEETVFALFMVWPCLCPL